MENSLSVAKNFYDRYSAVYGQPMREMKMHKLMYLVQRESLMMLNAPLFDEQFLGWKYGPVLQSVRKEYKKSQPFLECDNDCSQETDRLVDAVLKRYGRMSDWSLSALSHGELSWKRSRVGLASEENGTRPLELEAMRVDAARERSLRRRYADEKNAG